MDDKYRQNNYDICNAINMLKLGIVLDKMTKMEPETKAAFQLQASGLLRLLRTENKRLYDGAAKHGK